MNLPIHDKMCYETRKWTQPYYLYTELSPMRDQTKQGESRKTPARSCLPANSRPRRMRPHQTQRQIPTYSLDMSSIATSPADASKLWISGPM